MTDFQDSVQNSIDIVKTGGQNLRRFQQVALCEWVLNATQQISALWSFNFAILPTQKSVSTYSLVTLYRPPASSRL